MSALQLFLKKLWFHRVNIAVPSIVGFAIYSDLARTKRYKEEKKIEAAEALAAKSR